MRNVFTEVTTGFGPVLFGLVTLGVAFVAGIFLMGALLF
jgi:hypothetical protein